MSKTSNKEFHSNYFPLSSYKAYNINNITTFLFIEMANQSTNIANHKSLLSDVKVSNYRLCCAIHVFFL